jgi:hypothetical protein
MSVLEQIEIELTEEQAAEVRTLMDSGDEKALGEFVDKMKRLQEVQGEARALRDRMIRDTILGAFFWLKQGNSDNAYALLGPVVAMFTGKDVPADIIKTFTECLNETNALRAMANVQGHA